MSGKKGHKNQWQALNIYVLAELRLVVTKEIVEHMMAVYSDEVILVQLSEKLGDTEVHI